MPQATKDPAAGVVVTTTSPGHLLHPGRPATHPHRGSEPTAQIGPPVQPTSPLPRVPHGAGPRTAAPPADATSDTGFVVNEPRSARSTASTATTSRTRPRLRQPVLELPWQRQHGERLSHPRGVGHRHRQRERPTLRLVNSGNVCSTDFVDGCVVVLPLCPRSNGRGGTNYRATASTWVSSRSPTWRTTTSTRSSGAAPPSTRAGSWDPPIPTAPHHRPDGLTLDWTHRLHRCAGLAPNRLKSSELASDTTA